MVLCPQIWSLPRQDARATWLSILRYAATESANDFRTGLNPIERLERIRIVSNSMSFVCHLSLSIQWPLL